MSLAAAILALSPQELPQRALPAHAQSTDFVGFTPDGKFFLTAGATDRTVKVWLTKRLDAVFGGPGTGIWTPSCLEFSPDGRWLAAGGVLIAKDAPAGKRVSGPVFLWKLK